MAKVAYAAAGLTIAEVEAAIESGTGFGSSELTRIDQAITLAGQAAAAWQGRGWWWSRKKRAFVTSKLTVATVANSGAARSSNVTTITTTAAHGLAVEQDVCISEVSDSTFDGVYRILTVPTTTTFTILNPGSDVEAATAGTGSVYVISYPLRSVQSNALQDLYAPYKVSVDADYDLEQIPVEQYDRYLITNTSVSEPQQYALYGDLHLGLLPYPDTASRLITVHYIVRHSEITNAGSDDAALIVPAEYQWGVYVSGAEWIIKHETADPAALENCPDFVATMQRMAAAEATHFDNDRSANLFRDARDGNWPNDRPVWRDGLGYHVSGWET